MTRGRQITEDLVTWLLFTVLVGLFPFLTVVIVVALTGEDAPLVETLRNGSLAAYGIVATGMEVGFRNSRLTRTTPPDRTVLDPERLLNGAATVIFVFGAVGYTILVVDDNFQTVTSQGGAAALLSIGLAGLGSVYSLGSIIWTSTRLRGQS